MRVEGWPEVMNATIDEWRGRTLVYGVADCFQFCAAMALAITEHDHRVSFPAYASKQEADAIIASFGSCRLLLTSVLGEDKPPAFAQRGDIVLMSMDDDIDAPGICVGAHAFVMGLRGLVAQPMRSAVAAWTV